VWEGMWFQILGPQTEKARFSNWVHVLMTRAALVVEERNWWHPDSAMLNATMLLRYAGRTLTAEQRTQSLNSWNNHRCFPVTEIVGQCDVLDCATYLFTSSSSSSSVNIGKQA